MHVVTMCLLGLSFATKAHGRMNANIQCLAARLSFLCSGNLTVTGPYYNSISLFLHGYLNFVIASGHPG